MSRWTIDPPTIAYCAVLAGIRRRRSTRVRTPTTPTIDHPATSLWARRAIFASAVLRIFKKGKIQIVAAHVLISNLV
jgi:hypothetical protein